MVGSKERVLVVVSSESKGLILCKYFYVVNYGS